MSDIGRKCSEIKLSCDKHCCTTLCGLTVSSCHSHISYASSCCVEQNCDAVEKLKNQIAELEEEKGNLQLQLLDTDESKTGQCCLHYTLGW